MTSCDVTPVNPEKNTMLQYARTRVIGLYMVLQRCWPYMDLCIIQKAQFYSNLKQNSQCVAYIRVCIVI